MTTSKVLECPCRCCTSLVGFNSQCLYSAWSFFVFCRHPKVTPRHSCSVVGACSVAGRFFSLGSLSTVSPPPPRHATRFPWFAEHLPLCRLCLSFRTRLGRAGPSEPCFLLPGPVCSNKQSLDGGQEREVSAGVPCAFFMMFNEFITS